MIDDLPAFTAASLLRRNLWLIRLRWYAALGLLAGILGSVVLLPSHHDQVSLSAILAILILSNLFYLYATRISNVFTKSRLVKLLQTQMTVDILLLTLLIYYTGGIESPLSFFYVFHIIIASIIFPGSLPYLYAGMAVVLYTLLLAIDHLHLVPHVYFYSDVYMAGRVEVVIATWLIFLTTIFASAYLAKSVTDRHRRVRAKLELANLRLQEVNRSKTDFFRVSSHEMKSPIITVQSALMVVRDVLGDGVDPKVMDMIGRAIRKTDDMIVMLKDLSDLTYGSLKERAEFKQVNLCEIIHDAVEAEESSAHVKGIDVRIEVPDEDCLYYCDPHALNKVFNNLVSNAIRYTDEGGRVDIQLRRNAVEWTASVQDTGMGIPADEQQNIFQEFYRTPDARRTIKEGTGLGLAIVQRMVELHEGRIELKSEVGKGTTFTVHLPRGEES